MLHDLNLAARDCDDTVLLHNRSVSAAGPVDDVLRPEILEAVYGIGIRRLVDRDGFHLVFG